MSTVKLAVVDGNTINQTLDLRASKQGAPARIKAVKGGKFILADGQTGHGPENVTVRRVGKNLHLSLEGTDLDQPQLIIEDFYGNEGSLVGLGEDGAYHEYISSDADDDQAIAMLADGNASPQVLGAEKLAGFDAGSLVAGAGAGLGALGGLGLFGLAALGMLGAAAAAGAFNKGDGPNSGGGDGGDGGDGGGDRPKAPSIDSVVDNVGSVTGPIGSGGVTDDRRPVFSGKGETPGNRIELWDGDKKIGETVVKADGTWELQPAAPLDNGPHNIVAVEVDKNGNKSEPSDSFDFIVDTTAPDKPVIESIYDSVEPIGAIERDGLTNDNRPTLSGRGEPGARLEIFANGEKIGETTVNADGTWTFRPEQALADGPQEFTVVASDAAGNVGLPSDPWTVIVDTVAPDKPSIGDVWDNTDPANPVPIGEGEPTKDTTPVIGGEGEPGSTIIVIVDDEVVGSTIVGEDGKWEYELPELGEGSHDVEVIERDPAGNESEKSDPVTVIVDPGTPGDPRPEQPVIDGVWDNTDPDNEELIGEDGATKDRTPVLRGEGTEGDVIYVIVDGVEVGSTVVGPDNKWEFELPQELADGRYELEVIAERDGVRSEPSEPVTVIVDTTAPDKPSITEVFDNVGGQTGPLNPGDVTDDANPKVSGTAEPFSWVTLYDGDRIVGTAQADANGKWEITTDTLLNGPHSLTVKATDAAGNVSEPSDPFNFELVTGGTPTAPTIQNVIDNEGDNAGSNISPGGVTDDTRPTIIGTAKEGMVVHIYDTINGEKVLLGSVVAGPGDRWEFEVPADKALSEGLHNLSATATDPVGNVSPETGLYPIEVDTTPPNALEDVVLFDDVGDVTGPINSGDTTDDDRPTFSGRGEEGATIIIRDNGVVIGSTTVQGGRWSWEPTEALTDGPHSFTAQPVDAAGNKGPESAPIDFVVDTRDVEVSITSVMDDEGDIKGAIAPNGVTDDTTPTVIGHATAHGVVKIYDGETLLGSVTADAEGYWEFMVPADKALSEGMHTLNVTVTVPGQNESNPASFTFEVDTTAPNVGTIDDIHDDVGEYQGTIEPGKSTDDNTPTLSGTVEQNAWVIIRNGDTVIGSVQAGSNGRWDFTPANPLPDGTYDFNIVVRDAAGNESDPSEPWRVIIDTTPPAKPSIGDVWDNTDPANPVPIGEGEPTRDRTPVIGGSGSEEGSTIIVIVDGEEVGTAKVDENGEWKFEMPVELADGEYQFEVIEVDPAGNRSEKSEPVTVVVVDRFSSGLETFDVPRQQLSPIAKEMPSGLKISGSGSVGVLDNFGNKSLWVYTGESVRVEFPISINEVSFKHSELHAPGYAGFYKADGTFVGRISLEWNSDSNDPSGRENYYKAPEGLQFDYVLFYASLENGHDLGWIVDDIAWGTEVTIPESQSLVENSDLDSLGGEVLYLSEGEEEALEAEGSERIDVLKLTGSDQVLDLSNLEGKLSSIEVIDLTGTGANTLKLTLGDVLEQGGKDLFVNDGKTQMMIKGAEGDVVELSDLLPEGVDLGDWAQQAGTVTVEGTTYNVFYHAGMNAELLVQQGVTTHLENH
ncbi:Ig-like domain-containing protein [Burkholderia sp. AW49-1]